MPGVIDFETIYVDRLPTIWSPVQTELTADERAKEIEEQATASLLWISPLPEQILRILLNETAVERVYAPPPGFDPEVHGEWQEGLITFAFKRAMNLIGEKRTPDSLQVEYRVEAAGHWLVEITQDTVSFRRV